MEGGECRRSNRKRDKQKANESWEKLKDGKRGRERMKGVTEIMVEMPEEVCARPKMEVPNPWMIGRKEEINSTEGRRESVKRRNKRMNVLNAMRKLRAKRGGRGMKAVERKLERLRDELEARN